MLCLCRVSAVGNAVARVFTDYNRVSVVIAACALRVLAVLCCVGEEYCG
jgi:hypothetical protein